MAAKGFSFAEKMSRNAVMVTNGKASLPEVPHLTDDVTELERLVGEGRVLESRQDELRSQSQDNTKRMKTLASQADKLRARLAAGMQSKYGFTSETLLKFGVKLRKVPRRKAGTKSETPPAATTPELAGPKV
ncbi:MAG TPA: hypothetical protein VLV54_12415 [Thermoanaerobaculia bacterium]|nr:hypothetical protein [Thermoanaerobaculia bacterium]